MNRTDAPKKQPVVFGTNGQRENLPDTTPAGDNTASYDAGFPAVTMILKSAGGLPPKGQDMNQILYELSAIGRWLSAGALNSYDATFSSAVGGYPKASVLVGDDGSSIYISTVDANANNPNSTPTGWLSLAKITSIAGLAGGANKLPYFNGVNTAAQTDLTSVGRDIIGKTSIADILTYLGLGTAAKRDVGTGTNNIPDMNSFASGTGWSRLPNGKILQWGSYTNPGSVFSGTITFPIPFVSTPGRVVLTPAHTVIDSNPIVLVQNTSDLSLTAFSWRMSTTNAARSFNWLSIGE
ncbi:gp53-like domain-containing protein [Enterobacter soli]|uniref:gp53-like domain-containing protein n=1 Tax=Enterobacter soli TaxID=885040 RepID=UPI00289FCEC3|nr:phage tail protein [Enterobacter soli]